MKHSIFENPRDWGFGFLDQNVLFEDFRGYFGFFARERGAKIRVSKRYVIWGFKKLSRVRDYR